MHLVCLGVMKRFLLLWIKGPLQCRLGSRVIDDISQHLLNLKSHIPSEFARKPRSLKEIDRWKATEFRQFLLYTGPVVRAEILHPKMYKNFLLPLVYILIKIMQSNYWKHLWLIFVRYMVMTWLSIMSMVWFILPKMLLHMVVLNVFHPFHLKIFYQS